MPWDGPGDEGSWGLEAYIGSRDDSENRSVS